MLGLVQIPLTRHLLFDKPGLDIAATVTSATQLFYEAIDVFSTWPTLACLLDKFFPLVLIEVLNLNGWRHRSVLHSETIYLLRSGLFL